MPSRRPNRWAVLVGIDFYSKTNPRKNLSGCVADVCEVKSFLETSLRVPPKNIDVLTASVGAEVNNHPLPTKTNVIKAIQSLSTKAKAGDFVYIHYSGHGDREPTIYSKLKGRTTTHDEVLCTLEEDIRDVELGNLLDSLGEKGLLLCVVLDCCHSGSATRRRADTEKVRRRGANESPEDSDEEYQEAEGVRGGSRNLSSISTWLNRPQSYNLIAACQPNEEAQEIIAGSRTRGALTYLFMQSLRSFETSNFPITYEMLYENLKPKFRSLLRKQQPMHLGDSQRIVFGTARFNKASPGLLTSVVAVDESKVTLGHGQGSRVGHGDCFNIWRPDQVCMGLVLPDMLPHATVRITEVRDHDSDAELQQGSLMGVQVGWLAKMSSRAQQAIINVRHHGGQAIDKVISALDRIPCDPLAPAYFIFNSNRHHPRPTFFVHVNQHGACEVLSEKDQKHSNIPSVNLFHQHGPRKLAYLIQHLSCFRMVSELKNDTHDQPPLFNFQLQRLPPVPKYRQFVSIWGWNFTNEDMSQPLYITILSLSPAYGVAQLYPAQKADSASVESGKSVSGRFGIEVPPLLASKKGITMQDTIKLLITTEPMNFSHYEMHDLTDGIFTTGGRIAKELPPEIAPWHVVDKYIFSQL